MIHAFQLFIIVVFPLHAVYGSNISLQCDDGSHIPIQAKCDGLVDCPDGSDETELLCNKTSYSETSFRCQYGAYISINHTCNGKNDCVDSSDEDLKLCDNSTSVLETHTTTCPIKSSPRVTTYCTQDMVSDVSNAPCTNDAVPVGTKVMYECNQHYVPDGLKHINNSETECLNTGNWSHEFLRCKPDCGKLGSEVATLIVNGVAAPNGIYSWHVALYKWQRKQWSLICGGSLLNEYAVITAAHCVWKSKAEHFRVAMGKYYRDIEHVQDFTQIRNVSEIYLPVAYQDQVGNYGSDLAVLLLNLPVEFTDTVRPVCIDWNQEFVDKDLRENNLGTVLGWGVNENDTFSNTLSITHIQVASDEKCIKEQPKDFKKYITYTSFCAGYRNGTGVCNGDSGGGLVFLQPDHNDTWMLQGIVSVSPRRKGTAFCDPKYYTVFTKVAVYVKWLREVMSTIEDKL